MMPGKPSILIVDDDDDMGKFVCAVAEPMGFSCAIATSSRAFLEKLDRKVAIIVLDIQMPGLDGIELLRMLGQRQCRSDIILMSGLGKRIVEAAEQLAQTLGLFHIGSLRKPFRVEELKALLMKNNGQIAPAVAAPKQTFAIEDSELRDALDHDEFDVHYQPQIHITTERIVALEALVRWRHPRLDQLIYPDDFIPQTEKLGLVDRLGWVVVKHALGEIGRFSESYGAPLGFAVNVSAQSLQQLRFPDTLAELAASYDVAMDRITLEITESGLIRDLSQSLDVLSRLRLMGVQLSIDDFGTGYSMMQQLHYIPATELKIDKSFVQQMDRHELDRAMALKTIEIGRELGIKVIAEGVETAGQLDFLRASGCDLAQGHLFSRPLPANEMAEWLGQYGKSTSNFENDNSNLTGTIALASPSGYLPL
jgi:EAL domain-containing protein (putative c-di-GMP-specific phosphodiesterase class I)/ActR/RegA family two-component response regulator